MKTQTVYNSDLHFEHTLWKDQLLFWIDELSSFEKRLEEISKRWTDKSVLAELDHFQNNFIIHKEKVSKMIKEINAHEQNMANHYKANEDVINKNFYKLHLNFRDKMETQHHIYNDLKKDFFSFLTKNM
ncbi:hypothetical protein C7447_101853 [Tenacibaculum adriaticum]|uniref:Uncharacterized protein n=1 Tax=Tenacibaculum adriaticum TaxID=413713 RepID=A0A5S5DZR9_9FLAO|nr:hypothetical protein [Tenacibaculum adriaticum]TYQ00243.1 hypothetical protein C7447_101853 [Tenacibaculum adriaticum]